MSNRNKKNTPIATVKFQYNGGCSLYEHTDHEGRRLTLCPDRILDYIDFPIAKVIWVLLYRRPTKYTVKLTPYVDRGEQYWYVNRDPVYMRIAVGSYLSNLVNKYGLKALYAELEYETDTVGFPCPHCGGLIYPDPKSENS